VDTSVYLTITQVCDIQEVSIKTEKLSLHFYDLIGKAVTFFLSRIAREQEKNQIGKKEETPSTM
jgi:hypothetical protein